jgi:transposase
VGEVAGVSRFRSKAAFARWDGTAPIPVWSSNETRHRPNRGGNRQVNTALHRITLTQWRGVGPRRDHVLARIESGKTKTEALRLLRRRLSDEVYGPLLADDSACAAAASLGEVIAASHRSLAEPDRRPTT